MNRKEYHNYFERRERVINKGSNEEKTQPFYCCKDDAPEDLREFIHSVHKEHFFDAFPNDWICDTIHSAFLDLVDNDIDDCSLDADPYLHFLWKWLGESYASEYCAEVIEEGLTADRETDIYKLIGCAQWYAKKRIYDAVNEFIGDEAE